MRKITSSVACAHCEKFFVDRVEIISSLQSGSHNLAILDYAYVATKLLGKWKNE